MDALRVTRPEFADSYAVEDFLARRSLVIMGLTGQDSAGFEMQGFRKGRSWRYLFSRRLAYAGALSSFETFYRDLERLKALPAHRREAEGQRIQDAAVKD